MEVVANYRDVLKKLERAHTDSQKGAGKKVKDKQKHGDTAGQ